MKKLLAVLVFGIFAAHFAFAVDLLKKEKFSYDSKGKRDPFVSIDSAPKEQTVEAQVALTPADKLKQKGITITSIVWDARNPSILIGDDILGVGQTIPNHSDVIIRDIEKDYVVFEVDGEMVEVTITN